MVGLLSILEDHDSQLSSADSEPITVLLVDDHTLFRAGLRATLQGCMRLRVVGEASNGFEAIECASTLRPAVVLMDVRMPALDGLEVTRRLHLDYADVSVIIMANGDDEATISAAIDAGAAGYLLKNASPELLISTIDVVARGGVVVAASLLSRHARSPVGLVGMSFRDVHQVEPLTAREKLVLQHVADGYTNRKIGESLGYAEVTVKKQVQSIIAKLQVSDRTHAAITAMRLGLIT